MEAAATAFRKEITASGFATMPDCQSSRTIRAAGVIAVLLPSWNEVRNLSAGSYHSRISTTLGSGRSYPFAAEFSTTLGSDAGTIAIPSSPRVNSDGDLWCSPRRRFGSTKASRHCGVADISDSCCHGQGKEDGLLPLGMFTKARRTQVVNSEHRTLRRTSPQVR